MKLAEAQQELNREKQGDDTACLAKEEVWQVLLEFQEKEEELDYSFFEAVIRQSLIDGVL